MGWWTSVRLTLFLMAGGQDHLSRLHVRTRALCERMLVAHVVTELMGLSLLSPADGLRLFPYAVPTILTWRRQMQSPDTLWAQAACDLRC